MCTPYWVVGYMGDQMTLYEGIWLSCYREQGVGSWVCSTYDTIRNLFEQPGERCNSVCNRGGRNSVLLFIAGLAVPVYWTLTLGGRGGGRGRFTRVRGFWWEGSTKHFPPALFFCFVV